MNRTLPNPLRTTLIVIAGVAAIAAALALGFLGVAQWLPEGISSGRIQWDDHSVVLTNAFSGGIVDFILALGVTTLAVLIAFAAIVFAATVTVIVLTITAGALALVTAIICLPFLLILGIVWWVVRRNKRQVAMMNTGVRV